MFMLQVQLDIIMEVEGERCEQMPLLLERMWIKSNHHYAKYKPPSIAFHSSVIVEFSTLV